MNKTTIYDRYWQFASERHQIYERRLSDPVGPWTDDPILAKYRFTNTFRAADRVSQYLIGEVQYGHDRSQSPDEVFFRTILFKIFNKIETWEFLEAHLGPVTWKSVDLEKIAGLLISAANRGRTIYSAAYIIPAPPLGHQRKVANHIDLLSRMMADGLPSRIEGTRSLERLYRQLLCYPGLGPFLAYQLAIDLNYSQLTDCSEDDFIVAGPGALDGMTKCFAPFDCRNAESEIFRMVENQDAEFQRLKLPAARLFGRSLKPIDCQNVFCEISKYTRVSNPEIEGSSGRKRIKQSFRASNAAISWPKFPPKWRLAVPSRMEAARDNALPLQRKLL
jgi:hypothetical protein